MVAYLGYIQQEQQADNAHLELKQETERLNYEWHMAFKNLRNIFLPVTPPKRIHTVLPTRDQIFKHLSLWEAFSLKPPHIHMYIIYICAHLCANMEVCIIAH